jgi:6-phosphogluconolactonase
MRAAKVMKIKYYVENDPAALARHAAQYFLEMTTEAVQARGRARIAISGGSTPKTTFALLADPNEPWHNHMPWENLDLYWVDERCVPPGHPDSNYRMTREAMLDQVPLKPEQIHRIEGELDPETAAARYESELRNSFRLDPDGHCASLFPHTDAIHELSRLAVANHVPQQKDSWRITLTWPVINHASSVFFLIAGTDKAAVLNEVLTGPRDVDRLPSQLIWPASGILTLILDKAAAALLPATDGEGCGFLERER